jgi:hypothetical protein
MGRGIKCGLPICSSDGENSHYELLIDFFTRHLG